MHQRLSTTTTDTMGNHQDISSFIWKVCDDELRGLFKPHEYGDVILPFVVLRRLDCLIEPHKDEVVKQYHELLQSGIDDPTPIIRKRTGLNFFNHSPYDLTRLKSRHVGQKRAREIWFTCNHVPKTKEEERASWQTSTVH